MLGGGARLRELEGGEVADLAVLQRPQVLLGVVEAADELLLELLGVGRRGALQHALEPAPVLGLGVGGLRCAHGAAGDALGVAVALADGPRRRHARDGALEREVQVKHPLAGVAREHSAAPRQLVVQRHHHELREERNEGGDPAEGVQHRQHAPQLHRAQAGAGPGHALAEHHDKLPPPAPDVATPPPG